MKNLPPRRQLPPQVADPSARTPGRSDRSPATVALPPVVPHVKMPAKVDRCLT